MSRDHSGTEVFTVVVNEHVDLREPSGDVLHVKRVRRWMVCWWRKQRRRTRVRTKTVEDGRSPGPARRLKRSHLER